MSALRCFYRLLGQNYRKECLRRMRVAWVAHKKKESLQDRVQLTAKNTALNEEIKRMQQRNDTLEDQLHRAAEADASIRAAYAKEVADLKANVSRLESDVETARDGQRGLESDLEAARAMHRTELGEMMASMNESLASLSEGHDARLMAALTAIQERERAERDRRCRQATG